ncbi:hypothetical protein QYE76_063576 [Lolium multiflorum]|uniref:Reverse transcriptase domain-containing protein n=1 Tax=Lolium multiflorum TaxID=4521 RepID=A0AAD8S4T9_LOLMU|nr:hypothetical protein QYE76_063576 [Lolium multiflorum]
MMTWREYEALRNEMRREFRTQDDELRGQLEISQKLDATNETKKKTLSFRMKHAELVVVLDVVTVVVALLNSELAVSLHNNKTMVWPVSNVSNTKKSESAASTSGSSMSIARNRDMNFHTCGGKGHFKRDCPNRKVMIINEDNEYETGDDVDPYPSEARTIVVSQRALNVLPSASTQRCNLFQTKALVGPDKACKVIIDGGSCRNLASKELCTKLKLKYLPHPHPYYIQWLSDNGEMKVNHMVHVEFEIGPYKDSIDFDVVPMTEFSDVFPEEVPAGLPPLRGIEHQIDLIPGASLPNRAPYRTNPEETKEIQKQVQALLDKGYIRISLSPCVVPVILVPKKDGTWRMCVDCRAINNITIRYRHPIPRLEDMLDELSGAVVFSKIDLRSGYHQIRMKEGDEWKTAFKTKFGLYEWLVMPFGLTNAPSTFMRLMNHVLRDFIGKFVVVYFDDILIYSRNESDHTIHIRHVLQVLRDNKLYGNLEKCTFCKDKVIFLGYVVSKHGVEVDVSKIEAIQNWPTPMNVSQVRSFHGLAGFYRRFVPNFSTIAAPLNELTKKGVVFEWGAAQDHAFDELKRLLTSAPLLALPDFNKQFEIECDASGIGIGGVLMQEGRPIAYFSEKLSESSVRLLLLQESHAGGLMGHFGREKTLLMLADHFYWPKMRRDVDRVNMEASKRADFVRKIHVKTKELIEKKGKSNAARMNKKRKKMLFKPGDMVWVHFRKDRFPKLRKSKLLPRGAGPYKVLAKINDNAYSIDLPLDEFGVSNSFNVADLTPYDGEDLGAYEEGASVARGGEEQLDMDLDMELDKTTHGRAREEREACAREDVTVHAGPASGQTGRHAGAVHGPVNRAHADPPGANGTMRLRRDTALHHLLFSGNGRPSPPDDGDHRTSSGDGDHLLPATATTSSTTTVTTSSPALETTYSLDGGDHLLPDDDNHLLSNDGPPPRPTPLLVLGNAMDSIAFFWVLGHSIARHHEFLRAASLHGSRLALSSRRPATAAAVITSVPLPAMRLGRGNFMMWCTLSLPNLSEAGFHSHLDGTTAAPVKTIVDAAVTIDNPVYAVWWKQDQRVLGHLLSSMDEDIVCR